MFLARLRVVHGEDTPEVLPRMADQLECLEAERMAAGEATPNAAQ